MTINVIDLDDDQIIWRYLSLDKFVSLLHTSALHLARTDKFTDPWDGLLPQSVSDYLRHALSPMGSAEDYKALDDEVRRLGCVSCWHMNEDESAALWDLYARPSGLAICSTVGALKGCLRVPDGLTIAPVKYVDFDSYSFESTHGVDYSHFALYKRKSFSHERELRVVRMLDWGKSEPEGISTPVDLKTLIGKILVAPSSPRWFADVVIEVCRRFGHNFEVQTSGLYDGRVY